MKLFRLFFVALFSLLSLHITVQAQENYIFLFDEFQDGIITMKDGTKAVGKFNYDTAERNMLLLDGQEILLLADIDKMNVINIGSRKFIAQGKYFVEEKALTNGRIYINWKYKELNTGKKGAFGLTTQGTVENIRNNTLGTMHNTGSIDVYKAICQNEYWIKQNSKTITIKDKKGLLKSFPKHTDKIETFIKENSIEWNNVDDVIKLLDFCLGL